MKKGKWEIAPRNEENIAFLQRQLGIGRLAATVLSVRGLTTPEAALEFLKTDASGVFDPFLMADMEKAVAVINDALEKGERIAIYGDYDVDGITATSIMVRYLKSRGADCLYYIPDRINEGYGLNECAISALYNDGCRLLITVDSGITAINEVAHAKSLGIRVIITDHHECREELPAADAVVNPRRGGDSYPFRELAGVGVAFKLICAMESGRGTEALLDEYADVVAVGTIADVMPLVCENRIISSWGIRRLKCTKNVGLKALMNKLGLEGKPLTANAISFILAPRINAAGRLGEAAVTASLMLTDNCEEACALAERLCELNRIRQEEENSIFEEIAIKLDQNPELLCGRVLILWGDGWHTGVIGIVASRLSDRYGMPCILISMTGDCGKGSGRSIKGFSLYSALGHCEQLLERYGGHELAVGLSINRKNLQQFKQAVEEYAEKSSQAEGIVSCLNIDCAVEPEDISLEEIKGLSVLEPFGMGNLMPVFTLAGARIEEITPISHDRHVKIYFSKNGSRFCGLVFGMGAYSCPFVPGDEVDLAFSAEVNYFKGAESVQLVIKEIRWGNTCREKDAKAYEAYRVFTEGNAIDKDCARALCPCKEDLVSVFRYIRTKMSNGVLRELPQTLYRKVKYESKCCMNLGKFMVCIDIFKEFGIFDYVIEGDNVYIVDKNPEGRVDINGSRILKGLMDIIKG